MNYKKYILATLAGIIPVIVLIAIYGNNGKILNALIWIASISLAALLLYIFLDRHKRRAAYAGKDPVSDSSDREKYGSKILNKRGRKLTRNVFHDSE